MRDDDKGYQFAFLIAFLIYALTMDFTFFHLFDINIVKINPSLDNFVLCFIVSFTIMSLSFTFEDYVSDIEYFIVIIILAIIFSTANYYYEIYSYRHEAVSYSLFFGLIVGGFFGTALCAFLGAARALLFGRMDVDRDFDPGQQKARREQKQRRQQDNTAGDEQFQYRQDRFHQSGGQQDQSSGSEADEYESIRRQAQDEANKCSLERAAKWAEWWRKRAKEPGLHPKIVFIRELTAMLLQERADGYAGKQDDSPLSENEVIRLLEPPK